MPYIVAFVLVFFVLFAVAVVKQSSSVVPPLHLQLVSAVGRGLGLGLGIGLGLGLVLLLLFYGASFF